MLTQVNARNRGIVESWNRGQPPSPTLPSRIEKLLAEAHQHVKN